MGGSGYLCLHYWPPVDWEPAINVDMVNAWYVMVMYLACETFMENHLTTLDSTFFLKLVPENQGQVVA